MALTITNVQRVNGPTCSHLNITVDHEGTSRQVRTSFVEIDALLAGLSPSEEIQMLVILWAAYRRKQGRTVQSVVIA